MSTQPNPEHVTAGAALRRIDKARDHLRDVQIAYTHARVTKADVEQAHAAYDVAVAAYYEEGGK